MNFFFWGGMRQLKKLDNLIRKFPKNQKSLKWQVVWPQLAPAFDPTQIKVYLSYIKKLVLTLYVP